MPLISSQPPNKFYLSQKFLSQFDHQNGCSAIMDHHPSKDRSIKNEKAIYGDDEPEQNGTDLSQADDHDYPDGPIAKDPVRCDTVNYEICCILAEGSPTKFVSNFSSMIELYEKVAQSFNISTKEIMYCTLNTPKIDMDQVLSGQICLNDIVFVHRRGRRKEVEVTKTEHFLGLTIADNGNGLAYIKKIKQNSTASRVPFIQVGDHIESIMGETMVGSRHYEVARFLKSIPLNEIFTISLVEPLSSMDIQRQSDDDGFDIMLKPATNEYSRRISYNVTWADQNHPSDNAKMAAGLHFINKQLEKFLGIYDDELAAELWLLALQPGNVKNPAEFAQLISHSDLGEFRFTDDFIFDIWAIVHDVLNGRLQLDVGDDGDCCSASLTPDIAPTNSQKESRQQPIQNEK